MTVVDLTAMAEAEARVRDLEAEVAEVAGLLNAAHGRLVELVGQALDEGTWEQWGIHSPSHWLAWQAGLAPARAAAVVRLAERREELPTAIGALGAGELSLDAAVEVARRAPAGYEASITDFARVATVSQLRRTLRDHAYDEATEAERSRPAEDQRSVSMGTDDRGWWCTGRLPADEGAVVEAAVRAARDDLHRQARRTAADTAGDEAPPVTLADGLLAVAEASLHAGEARLPGTDRYRVHLHLDATAAPGPGAGSGGGAPPLSVHLGPALPTALRHLLLCDTTLTPVWQAHGTPVSVGRATRVVSPRLRRLIEHRDRGCRVPGCPATRCLEVHHITHWEHGGPTDTGNLLALCRRHHRLHHTGHLAITGDPDLPRDHPGALRVADRWGRTLPPTGTPATTGDPTGAPGRLGIEPGHYQHPLGERLDRRAVHFTPDPPPPPGGTSPPGGPTGPGRRTGPRPPPDGGPPPPDP